MSQDIITVTKRYGLKYLLIPLRAERYFLRPKGRRARLSIKEGTGIDLSVAQEIIHLYKWKMEIDKSEGLLPLTIRF